MCSFQMQCLVHHCQSCVNKNMPQCLVSSKNVFWLWRIEVACYVFAIKSFIAIPLCIFHCLLIGASFSTPVFSTPLLNAVFFTLVFPTTAAWSRVFHSCLFHPCCLVCHFQLRVFSAPSQTRDTWAICSTQRHYLKHTMT